jgi:hypothetical protein
VYSAAKHSHLAYSIIGKFKGNHKSSNENKLSLAELADILRTDEGEALNLSSSHEEGSTGVLTPEEMECILDRSEAAFSEDFCASNTSRIQQVRSTEEED